MTGVSRAMVLLLVAGCAERTRVEHSVVIDIGGEHPAHVVLERGTGAAKTTSSERARTYRAAPLHANVYARLLTLLPDGTFSLAPAREGKPMWLPCGLAIAGGAPGEWAPLAGRYEIRGRDVRLWPAPEHTVAACQAAGGVVCPPAPEPLMLTFGTRGALDSEHGHFVPVSN